MKMKEKLLTVRIKRPGKSWEWEIVENSLKSLQELVGGYIEVHTVTTDMAVMCNEEGRINGMELNCRLLGTDWYGPVVLIGIKGEEFASVPHGDRSEFERMVV